MQRYFHGDTNLQLNWRDCSLTRKVLSLPGVYAAGSTLINSQYRCFYFFNCYTEKVHGVWFDYNSRKNNVSSKQDTSCQLLRALGMQVHSNKFLHVSAPKKHLKKPTCWSEKGTLNTAGLRTRCQGKEKLDRFLGKWMSNSRIYDDDVILKKKRTMKDFGNCEGSYIFLIPFTFFFFFIKQDNVLYQVLQGRFWPSVTEQL